MDTSKLEKFCLSITDPEDANALLAAVRQRGLLYRLDPEASPLPADAEAVDGRLLTPQEKEQRARLAKEIAGSPERYAEVVRHAAYSWFNRIVAIRYMELHDFLPSHVRMFSQPGVPQGQWVRPQCLAEAPYLELPGLDKQEVLRLSDGAHDEELFRMLLLAQCAQLTEFMPDVFGRVSTSEALLLPSILLGEMGLVRRLVCEVPEEQWGSEDSHDGNQAEVLGWLYQFYVARDKDDAFASFKKGKKATPEKIGPATQLFTPEWIVRYMVQNSLGRLWMLNNPDSKLAEQMEFYIAPEGEPGDFVRIEGPEDISFCDPACGSAHILACAFDLLVEMYRERGYRDRDAARLILEKNLHGMEIDERAAQVAELVLNMRACSLDRRFISRAERPRPDVCILKPVEIPAADLPQGCRLAQNNKLLDALAHLTECGSLLAPTSTDLAELREAIAACTGLLYDGIRTRLEQALDLCEHLSRTFDVVVANPPYMGSSNFDPWTSAWIKANYPDVKSDLCTCFIERGFGLAKHNGYSAMVTMQSWMFLGSFEKMREKLLRDTTITSMCHLGARAFDAIGGEVVATTATVFQNAHIEGKGAYVRLVALIGSDPKRQAMLEAIQNPACGWFYRADAATFKDIPGTPIAYWASESMRKAFENGKLLGMCGRTSKGLITGDNDFSLRMWWECPLSKFDANVTYIEKTFGTGKEWFPCNKGGIYRKWFGNHDYVIRWIQDGKNVFEHAKATGHHSQDYDSALKFKPNISWSDISSGLPSFRFRDKELSDHKGMPFYPSLYSLDYFIGLLNSTVASSLLSFLSPTMSLNIGELENIPVLVDNSQIGPVEQLSNRNISLSRFDWDSFETSWDFKRHPLV